MKHSLSLLMEGLGDIPLGSVDVEKCSNLKTQIKKLPSNRKKLPQYREKSFHELVQMNIKESDRISVMTFNKHIQFISSFMNWGCDSWVLSCQSLQRNETENKSQT